MMSKLKIIKKYKFDSKEKFFKKIRTKTKPVNISIKGYCQEILEQQPRHFPR